MRKMADLELDEETIAFIVTAVNGCWILVAGVMCFLLQAGFGLLECGNVRAKNAQNIMIKNLMDASVAAISYYICGWAFAYGDVGNPFIGGSQFCLANQTDYISWFFQYVFAGTTATIVSGAVAERCQFVAYLVYTCFLTGFMYPVVSHWIWSGDGWMVGKVLDFAGGGAVHGVGGAAALAAAWILGPRKGRFETDPETGKVIVKKIPPHNLVLATLGGFLLWFGFFPFNSGSGLDIASPDGAFLTGRVAIVTTLGGATGGLTMLIFGRYKEGHWDLPLALNGTLGGLIATCGGVNTYKIPVSFLVGIVGAFAYYVQEWVTINIFHIDDPLSAAALHMGSGFAGVIMAGLFAEEDFVGEGMGGLFIHGTGTQLGWQIAACLAYFAWGFGTSAILFTGLNAAGLFRASEEEELVGMDISHHGGPAYLDETLASIEEVKKEVKKEVPVAVPEEAADA